jgi:hypothetical protein
VGVSADRSPPLPISSPTPTATGQTVFMTNIALTGVTGRVGGRVARQLATGGEHTLNLIARDASRIPDVPGAAVSTASYGDAQAVARALARADVVFMVSGHESADRLRDHFTFIEAAARAGVTHIVYTSFVGAGSRPDSPWPVTTAPLSRQSATAGWTTRSSATTSTSTRSLTSPTGMVSSVGRRALEKRPRWPAPTWRMPPPLC